MNLLLLVLTLTGMTWVLGQVQAPAGVIEGYVVVAGTNPPEPLLNARAELSSTAGSIVARTDNAGKFVFSNIPAARYRLLVTKDGYLRQEYRSPVRTQNPPIDVRAGQTMKDIVFRMNPAPTISGVVRDRIGSPIANILVKALKRGYDPRGNRILTPIASTRTDDHGVYRLYWLDLGEYFLSAEREGLERATTVQGISASEFAKDGALRSVNVQTTYAPTYFPGFAEPEDAKPIELELGRDAGGMDFVLSQSTLATVAVAISTREGSRGGGARGGAANADVTLTRPDGIASTARYGGRAQGGSLALGSVAPGTYLITASSGSERAAQRIRVTNADLYVRMTLSEGVVLNGSVVNNQGSPLDLRKARINIAEADPILPSPPPAAINVNNRFSIAGLQRGLYSVNVSGLPDDSYLKAAEYSADDALVKPFAVDDSPGATASELKILIGLDGGRISGAAFDRNNQRFAGAQIILVPDSESRFRFDRYRYALAGEDGAFVLRGIPPGEYKLFAWDEIEANGELNSEYMRAYESLGTPVRIAPGENPAVGVRVIQTGR